MSSEAARSAGQKTSWGLSQAAFDRLLDALDDDRERAAVAYEQLRRRLAGLLEWWGAISADELVDTTLDRVARTLEEGAVIQKGSLGAYMRGVARMVFYESTRKPRTEVLVHDVAEAAQEEGLEPSLACLDRCLQTLDAGERRLALEYYENGDKAAIRRTLAHALGLSATALRIRAHRLRERLENCVSNCLGGHDSPETLKHSPPFGHSLSGR